jgi:hypothetical protein
VFIDDFFRQWNLAQRITCDQGQGKSSLLLAILGPLAMEIGETVPAVTCSFFWGFSQIHLLFHNWLTTSVCFGHVRHACLFSINLVVG